MHHKQEVIAFVSDAVTNGALHPNQEGADHAEDQFVTSAIMTVGGETSNAIEISSESGTNSSAERQNQEPKDSMAVVPPCEINTGTLMGKIPFGNGVVMKQIKRKNRTTLKSLWVSNCLLSSE